MIEILVRHRELVLGHEHLPAVKVTFSTILIIFNRRPIIGECFLQTLRMIISQSSVVEVITKIVTVRDLALLEIDFFKLNSFGIGTDCFFILIVLEVR